MRRSVRILFVILSVLIVVPGWSGDERLALWGPHAMVAATPVALDPNDPARRNVGALTYLGGVTLTGNDPAFGGYSSLAVEGDRFTLLSDGGNVLAFTMGRDWRLRAVRTRELPAGPGTGWKKQDRDSESFALADGHGWVGLELANAIWRYDRGLARVEGHVQPGAMRHWPPNGGPEAMARLPDGRFVVLSEEAHVPPRVWAGSEPARLRTRDALLFARDPLTAPPPRRFAYVAHGRYDVSDAAALPDGSLLVLERALSLPFRWSAIVSRVAPGDVRPGAVARGRVIAKLDAPLLHDNFEGIAVTREGGATIVWLVSDDNQLVFQRTLLLKFRLDR